MAKADFSSSVRSPARHAIATDNGLALQARLGVLQDAQVQAMLAAHAADMYKHSPPGTCHYFDSSALARESVRFYTYWTEGTMVGCGALYRIDETHAELKSMRLLEQWRGTGASGAVLRHLIAQARTCGYTRISLETGVSAFFAPAIALYRRHGFSECAPFGQYQPSQHNLYMTMQLSPHRSVE